MINLLVFGEILFKQSNKDQDLDAGPGIDQSKVRSSPSN